MKDINHLQMFLSAVKKNEIPNQETLDFVADALLKMEEGSSFKSAFDIQTKLGRPAFKEKDIRDVIDGDIFKISKEYVLQKKKGDALEAKLSICEKYNITERTFDTYYSIYNKVNGCAISLRNFQASYRDGFGLLSIQASLRDIIIDFQRFSEFLNGEVKRNPGRRTIGEVMKLYRKK